MESKDGIRVVIIGGVAAGASCAARCRRLNENAEICMVEKGDYVSFANCGLPYYVGNVIKEESKLLVAKPALFKERFGIHVYTKTEALTIDSAKKVVHLKNLESGETFDLGYDYLVLATGSTPIRPPLPGVDLPNVFSVHDIPDARHIKEYIQEKQAKRAVVVGGGFVGLEMVENLVHLGCEVDLVEALPQVMGPLDPEMAQFVADVLRAKNVNLHLSEAVAAFEKVSKDSDEVEVVTKSGTRIRTDLIVMGIGVRPALGLAQAAGIKLGERGIAVDDHMRTSDPSIFAAGDAVESKDVVTGQHYILALAGPANRQGRIVADNIFGVEPSVFRGVQGTSVCGLFGATIAMTGASEKSLKRAGLPYNYIFVHPSNHASYYPGAEQMHIKLLFHPETGKVLGAQAVGRGDGIEKRIDVISMAIQGGMTCFDLEEAELCYSPQFGSAKDPVNFAGMTASNVLRGIHKITHWPEAIEAERKGEAILLDVRSVDEYEGGHAPNSINIPVNDLRLSLESLPKDKIIMVYCLVGIRGYLAERILLQHGFEKVQNITGGWISFPSNDFTM